MVSSSATASAGRTRLAAATLSRRWATDDVPGMTTLVAERWSSRGPVADEVNRTAHYQNKARAYAAAQRAGILDDDLDPDHLVFLIIALAAWWLAVPQLARMLTGTGDSDPAEHARRRESVVPAARRL